MDGEKTFWAEIKNCFLFSNLLELAKLAIYGNSCVPIADTTEQQKKVKRAK